MKPVAETIDNTYFKALWNVLIMALLCIRTDNRVHSSLSISFNSYTIQIWHFYHLSQDITPEKVGTTKRFAGRKLFLRLSSPMQVGTYILK